MGKAEIIFKIIGVITSVSLGIASIVIELKRKTKITDEDKEDIAERTAKKISEKQKKQPIKAEVVKVVTN
jgi:hypothetical protein